jgi:hypothetical protein
VNDRPWCEPCANALIDETRRPWGKGVIVLTAGGGVVGLLAFAEIAFAHMIHYVAFTAMIAGVLALAGRVVFPATGIDRPRIERRA